MESIINQLASQEAWEEFLAFRLRKGRFTWRDFVEVDAFVEKEQYLPLVARLVDGGGLGLPRKKWVNKMGTGKKRVVYTYAPEEMQVLSLMAFLLYRYDGCFAPNCYAFRRGISPLDAIRHINKDLRHRPMWAYKLDIHDYFNSIPVERLLPKLKELLSDDLPLYRFFERMLTCPYVLYEGKVMEERHGIMAGTPTSPFLANVYLSAVDRHFHEDRVVYARYSDDIILFAPDQATLEVHRATLLDLIGRHGLTVNPDKERVYTPDEPFEFLGFKCHEGRVDIAESTKRKMKGKISRQARSLMRWRTRRGVDAEPAMKALIRTFNSKFFEGDDPETLTWSRWFFPLLTESEGLREIDRYLQQNIRYLSTGKHGKANYRVGYDDLKRLGYRSLVNEFYNSYLCKK